MFQRETRLELSLISRAKWRQISITSHHKTLLWLKKKVEMEIKLARSASYVSTSHLQNLIGVQSPEPLEVRKLKMLLKKKKLKSLVARERNEK